MALPLSKRFDGAPDRPLENPTHKRPLSPWRTAEVMAATSPGAVRVKSESVLEVIAVASHVPIPLPGQRVLIACADGAPDLVIATYPMAQEQAATNSPQMESFLQFDEQSGTLSIQANQLKLKGIGSIELHCGDAILRLNAQGELLTHAQTITQSAIGSHRIEGASVDIN